MPSLARLVSAGLLASAFLASASTRARSELVFPAVIEGKGSATVILRLPAPISGEGRLRWSWSDADGRLVQAETVPFALKDGDRIPFSLDTRRAVTSLNFITTRLTMGRGAARREKVDSASFIVSPPEPDWRDYHIIMWQPQAAAAYRVLEGMGIDAGMVHADRARPDRLVSAETDPLLAANDRWFVENIATDFYSAYHRYFPDRPPNWRFTEVQEKYRANPGDRTAFFRDPSLSDQAWLSRIRRRLITTVRLQARYRPLYYNLGDETGIADLAAFWDFDYSPPSLEGFRAWLRGQYRSLAALNREWGTAYRHWRDIIPETTAEAMRRSDDNFASWSDMKAWMDVAFAHALAAGRDAVHRADARAFAGIEGAQVPGWGGYDYELLPRAVDLMEIYDAGDNVAIARSFAPRMPILTTAFPNPDAAAQESHIWRELLRGARGLVLWDEQRQFVGPDGTPGPRAAAASYFRVLRNGIGALIASSDPMWDSIAILYSPASQRAEWMLDWKGKGDAWIGRDSEAEGGDRGNPVRAAVRAFMANFAHLGFEPRFVAARELEAGILARGRYRVLVLAHAIALSPGAARAVRRFVEQGGIVLADVEPGVFDEHGRRRERGPLADLYGQRIIPFAPALVDGSLDQPQAGSLGALAKLLGDAGVKAKVALAHADGTAVADVVAHRFRQGSIEILGLQRDREPGTVGPERVVLTLPHRAAIYDILRQKSLGYSDRAEFAIDAVRPTLLALSARALRKPVVSGPLHARRGRLMAFRIGVSGEALPGSRLVRVAVEGPDDQPRLAYAKNIVVGSNPGVFTLPLALNDPIGRWRLRFTDVATGLSASRTLDVAR